MKTRFGFGEGEGMGEKEEEFLRYTKKVPFATISNYHAKRIKQLNQNNYKLITIE